MQVVLDTAFAVVYRRKMADMSGPLYLWVDSSPQAGFDWLLSIFDYIPENKVLECLHHAHALFQSKGNIVAALQTGDLDAIGREALTRHEAGKFLVANIQRHAQIPMGLGSGASSLEHKCQALALKFSHESESFQHLRQVCANVVGFTVDLGVESGVSDAHGGDVVAYLPPWVSKQDRLRGDSGLDDGHLVSEQIFPNSVVSAGLDHVSNNMQDAMDAQLQGWEDWLPGFKAVTYLLSHRHLLTRLIGHCINGTAHQALARCFETTVPKIAHWRWGTICKTLPEVLWRERALRIAWDEDKFFQRGEPLTTPDDSPFKASVITSTIGDLNWWCYGRMLLALHRVGNLPSAWGSGCACHEWLQASSKRTEIKPENEALNAARTQQCLPQDFDGVEFNCPMKGKRAPEIASGILLENVNEEATAGRLEIMVECSSVSGEMHEKILNDFNLGVDYITMTLQLKVGQWWQSLPWMLAALALPKCAGPGEAASYAQAALSEFQKVPCRQVNHHPITWRLFQPRTLTRDQLEELAKDSNASLHDMPELLQEVCKLAFIPVVERVVEGARSLVHRHTGYRKVTGAYVSCAMRFQEMDQVLESCNSKQDFVAAFERMRKSRRLVKEFRLQEHPKWLELVSKPKREQGSVTKICNAMVYSTDSSTMFVQHQDTRQRHQRAKDLKAKAHGQVFQSRARLPITFENLKRKALVDDVGNCLKVGEFYSIPAAAVTAQSSMKPLLFLGWRPSIVFLPFVSFASPMPVAIKEVCIGVMIIISMFSFFLLSYCLAQAAFCSIFCGLQGGQPDSCYHGYG